MKKLLLILLLALALLPLGAAAGEEIILTVSPETVTVVPGGDANNEEMFDAYVSGLFSPRRTTRGVGDRLTGTDALIYGILKGHIDAVAAGTETGTCFTITLSDLGLEGMSWTAEELGVSAILYGGDVTQEAKDAVAAKVDCDLAYMLDVLLADCPYSLYWYDKTLGTTCSSFGYNLSTFYSDGARRIRITSNRPSYYYFRVHESYASDVMTYIQETDEYGNTVGNLYHCETNPQRVSAANAAVARANDIVSAHAGESDYDKLVSYKRDICALVTYNSEAANAENQYGDPWQLVYVFDGDPDTNVVCEGYSKALQYLCEHSAFQGRVICRSVTGWINGSSKGHMWNLITMPDGKVYHADVTNSDPDTSSTGRNLFLLGAYIQRGNEYVVKSGTSLFSYKYRSDTVALYSQDELTLSSSRYRPAPTTPDPDTLTTLTLPASLETIDEGAFEGVAAQRIVVPEGVTAIGKRAFAACPNLVYITLPDSLQSIATNAFADCPADFIFVFCGQEVASLSAIAGNEQLYVITQLEVSAD